MITFNALLRDEKIDPGPVKLIRHQDSRPARPTPYQLWVANDGRFERYQQVQGKKALDDARMIASFVVTPLEETLFVGFYVINGVGVAPKGMIDPLTGEDVGGLKLYDLKLSPLMANYRGRAVVDWGKGFRSWFQWAARNEKTVLEIRRTVGDPPFPGFMNFCERLSLLSSVPVNWRITLSAVGGVYLLMCPKEGKQYVGIAHGAGGFWGRWEEYAASGHGGNTRMRDLPKGDYQATILEVKSLETDIEELQTLESRWKRKLMTRQFGLNGN